MTAFHRLAAMTAIVAGISPLSGFTGPLGVFSTPSAAQQRRIDKWKAGAADRAALALEIRAWNKGVKRRNQRFVARQIARGRLA